jgi:hypothetical protein
VSQRVDYARKFPKLDYLVFPISKETDINNPCFSEIWLDRESRFESTLKNFLLWSQWQTMSILWKKELLQELGGFDESLTSCQDGYLHRAALITIHLEFLEKPRWAHFIEFTLNQ